MQEILPNLILVSFLMFTGCATRITRTDGPPEAPTTSFANFNRYILLDTVIAPRYAEHSANQAAAIKIHDNLVRNLRLVNPDLVTVSSLDELEPQASEDTLIISPKIVEIKFIGGAARFWAGALAGSSAVYMKVLFTEGGKGGKLANPAFYQHANAYGGAWSIGGTDNAMLIRIASLIAEYVSEHSRP